MGNVDANTGDPQTGWDTDQFLTDPAEATRLMLAVVKAGGLGSGGFNFDAKLRWAGAAGPGRGVQRHGSFKQAVAVAV